MVNRPLGVTTHTALGTPASVSSTCTWPPSGIGISTEPRSSRASSATAGSSKSSMSNGPSSSSSRPTGASRPSDSRALPGPLPRPRPRPLPKPLPGPLPTPLPGARRPVPGLCGGAAVVFASASSECHHKLACPPEEPWPPSPRDVSASPASSNDETSTSSTNSTRCTSNWAIRSPRLHHDRLARVEVDQRDLDLATIARVDGARTIDDRKPHPRGQSRTGVDQSDHPERDGDRHARPHQGTPARCQSDVFCAVEVNPGVAVDERGWASGARDRGGQPPDWSTRGHRLPLTACQVRASRRTACDIASDCGCLGGGGHWVLGWRR